MGGGACYGLPVERDQLCGSADSEASTFHLLYSYTQYPPVAGQLLTSNLWLPLDLSWVTRTERKQYWFGQGAQGDIGTW